MEPLLTGHFLTLNLSVEQLGRQFCAEWYIHLSYCPNRIIVKAWQPLQQNSYAWEGRWGPELGFSLVSPAKDHLAGMLNILPVKKINLIFIICVVQRFHVLIFFSILPKIWIW